MTCAVRQDRPVVVVMISADCSDAEAPPFHGADEAAQRACAIDWAVNRLGVASIVASIDGSQPVEMRTPRYFAVSPQMQTTFDAKEPVFDAARARWWRPSRVVGKALSPFVVHFNVFGGND
jgi:hypothetical protein